MTEEKKFETLEQVLEYMKPKSVFIVVEVNQKDFKAEQGSIYTKPINLLEHATRSIDITERVRAVDDKATVRNGTAYLQPTPEGQAKLMNQYAFISPGALHDITLSELTFVYRLDGRCEITHFPSNATDETPILPHHVVI